jgi:hypothetical protein
MNVVKIRYTEKNIFEIDRENPGFKGKRPLFKILATPLPLLPPDSSFFHNAPLCATEAPDTPKIIILLVQ